MKTLPAKLAPIIKSILPRSIKLRLASLRYFLRWRFLDGELPSLKGGIRVNFGPGQGWMRRGWVTVDHYLKADISLDLREFERLPWDDGAVTCIFASHVLEHMSDAAAQKVLSESHRVLKPGGLIRIAVPDFDRARNAYFSGDANFFRWGGVECHGQNIGHLLLNYIASFRAVGRGGGPTPDPEIVQKKLREMDAESFIKWGVSLIPPDADYVAHMNGYTAEKLIAMFKAAGFRQVAVSGYRQSACRELRGQGFDNRPLVSLFVEAFRD